MKSTTFLLALLLPFSLFAQTGKTNRIPLVAEKWTFEPQKVEFVQERDAPAMKLLAGAGRVVAKGVDFSNGTIEFDIKPLNPFFDSFYFRFQDANENECFYFRTDQSGNPMAMDAVQYTPLVAGVNLWDMLGHYQSNASFTREAWNHVKLVVSGAQMRVYVNNPTRPTLEIDRLEGNTKHGTLAFEGEMMVANLVVKPGEVEGLSPLPGIDPTNHDPRYIRSWAVSEALATPKNVDFSYDFLPTPETAWEVLEAERRGLVNLTRKFGQSVTRRLCWLKVKIQSATEQKKKVSFGFSDEVWVFLNGKLTYVDKNTYGKPIMKEPRGRCSIENSTFVLPLNKGNNELLVGVANDFYGWGIVARLENLEGLEIAPEPTFDARLVKLSDQLLDAYAGTYRQPNGKDVRLTREKHALKISGEGFLTGIFYPAAEQAFFMRDSDVEMAFLKEEASGVPNMVLRYNGKSIMELKKVKDNP